MKQSRPWQRHTVRSPKPSVVVTSGRPLAQLTIYADHLLLARRRKGIWVQYPVAPEGVAQALGDLPRSSGLLPISTLATGSVSGQPFLVRWIAPRVHTLRTDTTIYAVPLPPLVWAGRGDDYRIFALGERGTAFPADGNQRLYLAPLPNTYPSGAICWGDVGARPAVQTGSTRAWALFEESGFNTHIAQGKSKAFPNNVMGMWDRLAADGTEAYPLDDLIATPHTLTWLCAGGPWEGQVQG